MKILSFWDLLEKHCVLREPSPLQVVHYLPGKDTLRSLIITVASQRTLEDNRIRVT